MASRIGTTVTCDNATETEVWTNAIANLAQNGDTVVVPANTTDHWTSQHTLTKAITLQGAGAGDTTILNDYSGDSWIIINYIDDGFTRITGFTFQNGTSTGSGTIDHSVIHFNGANLSTWRFRFDHNELINLKQFPIFTNQALGVIDHNTLSGCRGFAYTYCREWRPVPDSNPTYVFGDGSWASPTDFATDNCVYFEDNVVVSATDQDTLFDGTRGGRLVVRHNTFTMSSGNSAAIFTCHGNENRNRSIRHAEFYNNNVLVQNGNRLIYQRGGTVIAFNNRVQSASTSLLDLVVDRQGDDTICWGRASGSNPVDINDTSAGGTNNNPTPFYTGTMGATTTTDFIKVSPSPGWTVNQWRGYSVSDTSRQVGVIDFNHFEVRYLGGVISSNTVDSITTVPAIGFGSAGPHNYASGDTFKIFRCLQGMDMVGSAGTSTASLVTGGNTSGNPPILPVGFNNQDLEPMYEWNNVLMPATNIQWNGDPIIRSGVHYYNDTVMSIANGASEDYPWDAVTASTCGADIGTNVSVTGTGGFTYPHPLTGAAEGKIILLSGNMAFGNVIIGQTPTATLTVTNVGDTLLTITGPVVYPTGFTGTTTGFTVAAGADHDITVTFTPLLAQLYSGNITFNSDADSGTESIAATGTGVTSGGGGHGKGHKKGALSRRT